MQNWAVFQHVNNQPFLKYIVSNPEIAMRNICGEWSEDIGTWYQYRDGLVTYTIVAYQIDHEEAYVDDEWRWVLLK
jgi:hypothetical protein